MSHSIFTQLSSISKDDQLKQMKSSFEEALLREIEILEEKNAIQQLRVQSLLEAEELKIKLKTTNAKTERLSNLIFEKNEDLKRQRLEISKLRKEIYNIENTMIISDANIKS